MPTRAFLLCGDEKAVQAVTQILDELEVSFEHSSEPAFSLKRLATQRFDLLIVDCDNAQNATQVFNSARASNLNKNSIAIAIVEGKAGVPSAFRLGASLVLTKPVSLEQARNTLRTGIGMTRKDTAEVKAAASIATAVTTSNAPANTPVNTSGVTPPGPPATLARPPATPTVLTPVAPSVPPVPKPIVEVPKPATVAAAPPDKLPTRPAMVPVAPPQEHKPALTNFSETKEPAKPEPAIAKGAASITIPSPTSTIPSSAPKNFDSVFKTPSAVEETKPKAPELKVDSKTDNSKNSPTLSIVDPLAEEDSLDPVRDHGVPSFGAIGKDSFAGLDQEQSGKSKGWLIAAVVLLFVGAGVYGAWATQPGFKRFVAWEYLNVMSKISGHHDAPQTVAQKPVPAVPVPAPVALAATPAVATDPATTAGIPADPAAIPAGSAGSSVSTVANGASSTETTPSVPATDAATAKATASLQSAKQDTNGSHATPNPSLVPANLPATPVAKAPSSELLEIPEDFADDQIVHRVHPTYPKQARARKLHGTVVLEAIVNKKGSVDSLQLVSGDSVLAQAAADAVKQWKYKPYSHNGEPTEFQTKITIDFKLP
jgi:TonB family protein